MDKDIQAVAVNDSQIMFLLGSNQIHLYDWQLKFTSSVDIKEIVEKELVENGRWSDKVNLFSVSPDRLLMRLFCENRFIIIKHNESCVLEHFTFVVDFTFSFIRSKSFIRDTICFYQDLENKICFMSIETGEWAHDKKVNKNLNLCYFDSVAIPVEWTDTKVYNRDVDYPIHTVCVYNKEDFFI